MAGLYTVVYKAVADFRDLYTEVAKARLALKALDEDLRRSGTISVNRRLTDTIGDGNRSDRNPNIAATAASEAKANTSRAAALTALQKALDNAAGSQRSFNAGSGGGAAGTVTATRALSGQRRALDEVGDAHRRASAATDGHRRSNEDFAKSTGVLDEAIRKGIQDFDSLFADPNRSRLRKRSERTDVPVSALQGTAKGTYYERRQRDRGQAAGRENTRAVQVSAGGDEEALAKVLEEHFYEQRRKSFDSLKKAFQKQILERDYGQAFTTQFLRENTTQNTGLDAANEAFKKRFRDQAAVGRVTRADPQYRQYIEQRRRELAQQDELANLKQMGPAKARQRIGALQGQADPDDPEELAKVREKLARIQQQIVEDEKVAAQKLKEQRREALRNLRVDFREAEKTTEEFARRRREHPFLSIGAAFGSLADDARGNLFTREGRQKRSQDSTARRDFRRGTRPARARNLRRLAGNARRVVLQKPLHELEDIPKFAGGAGGGSGGGFFGNILTGLNDFATGVDKTFAGLFRHVLSFRSVIILAIAALGPLVATLGALGGAAIGAAQSLLALAGNAALLPNLFIAGASAIAALILGLKPVATALSAYGKAQDAITAGSKDQKGALKDLVRAQQALNDARKQALRDLQDLRTEVDRANLSEAGAILALKRAQDDYRRGLADPNSTLLDREESLYRVKVAENDLADVRKKNKRSAEDLADAEKRGVEGNQAVLAAKDALANAQDTVNGKTTAAKTAQAAYQTALDKLGPKSRKVVEALVGQYDAYQKFKQGLGDKILGGIVDNKQLGDVPKVFGTLKKFLDGAAESIGGTVSSGLKLFVDRQKDIESILPSNKRIVDAFGKAVLSLVDGFITLAKVAAPFAAQFAENIAKAAGEFRDFLTRSADNGKMVKFFEIVASRSKQAYQIVKNLLSLVGSLFFASNDFASDQADSLVDITKKWADWGKAAEDPQSRFQGWLKQIRPLLSEVGHFIGQFAKAFAAMSGDQRNLDEAKNIFQALADDILPKIVGIFGALSQSKAVSTLVEAGGKILQVIQEILDSGGGEAINTFASAFEVIGRWWVAISKVPGVGGLIHGLAFALGALAAAAVIGKFSGLFKLFELLRNFRGLKNLGEGSFFRGLGRNLTGASQLSTAADQQKFASQDDYYQQGGRVLSPQRTGSSTRGGRHSPGAVNPALADLEPGGGLLAGLNYTSHLDTIIGLLRVIAGEGGSAVPGPKPPTSPTGGGARGGNPRGGGSGGGSPGTEHAAKKKQRQRARTGLAPVEVEDTFTGDLRGGGRSRLMEFFDDDTGSVDFDAPARGRTGRRRAAGRHRTPAVRSRLRGAGRFGAIAAGAGALGIGASIGLPYLAGALSGDPQEPQYDEDGNPIEGTGGGNGVFGTGLSGTDLAITAATMLPGSGLGGLAARGLGAGGRGLASAGRGLGGLLRGSGLARGLGAGGGLGAAGAVVSSLADSGAFGGKGSTGKQLGQAGGAVLQGAAAGALIGSVIPGVGTAIGAAVGGLAGLTYSLYKDKGLRDKIGGFFGKIGGFFADLGKDVARLVTKAALWVKQHIQDPIVHFFQAIFRPIFNLQRKVATFVYDYFIAPLLAVFLGLFRAFRAVEAKVRGWLSEHIVAPALQFFGRVRSAFLSVAGRVKGFLDEHVVEPLLGLVRRFRLGVQVIWGTVTQFVDEHIRKPIVELFSKIAGFFTGLPHLVESILRKTKVGGYIADAYTDLTGKQSGGLIDGTQDGRVDAKMIRITAGEYVMRQRVTNKPFAKALFEDLNNERLDPAALYAGLNVRPGGVYVPTAPVLAAAAPAAAAQVVNHRGVSMGDVTINNPVREKSERSLRRQLHKTAHRYT